MNEPKSQGQIISELLGSRIGQLEVENAILNANLELKEQECMAYKNEIQSMKNNAPPE